MIDVEVFSKAGIGKNNEDYALHSEIAPHVTLIVVCDGMGGLSNGAEASRIVAHSIGNYFRHTLCSHILRQTIVSAILFANDELAKECLLLQSKMGASVGLTLFVGNCCYYSWLGDVRVYLKQGGRTELLTKDHLAIEGNHSFLTRCINGREFRCSPVVSDITLHSGDEVFIATDGYYLHHDVGTPIEAENTTDDDATIVCIKLI
ncbi:MAG TPA: serine/threonine protein phosphatase [Porphyromonadaceae bacterium]|jgi:serine/threonine protein phosphatase PrpC|nr:serine/threonine protein phosphatase [Porphyromonadaceae bacterium]